MACAGRGQLCRAAGGSMLLLLLLARPWPLPPLTRLELGVVLLEVRLGGLAACADRHRVPRVVAAIGGRLEEVGARALHRSRGAGTTAAGAGRQCGVQASERAVCGEEDNTAEQYSRHTPRRGGRRRRAGARTSGWRAGACLRRLRRGAPSAGRCCRRTCGSTPPRACTSRGSDHHS